MKGSEPGTPAKGNGHSLPPNARSSNIIKTL